MDVGDDFSHCVTLSELRQAGLYSASCAEDTWRDGLLGERRLLFYPVVVAPNGEAVQFMEVSPAANAGKEAIRDWEKQSIALAHGKGRIDGGRRYFACPGCSRRVLKLYVERGGTRFRCRWCLGLDYPSLRRSRSERLDEQHLTLAATDIIRKGDWPPAFSEQVEDLRAKAKKAIRNLGPNGPSVETLQRMVGRALGAAGAIGVATPEAVVKRGPGRPRVKRRYERKKEFRVEPPSGPGQMFCPRCRAWRYAFDVAPVVYRNGRQAVEGRCEACFGRTSRFVSTKPGAGSFDKDTIQPTYPGIQG